MMELFPSVFNSRIDVIDALRVDEISAIDEEGGIEAIRDGNDWDGGKEKAAFGKVALHIDSTGRSTMEDDPWEVVAETEVEVFRNEDEEELKKLSPQMRGLIERVVLRRILEDRRKVEASCKAEYQIMAERQLSKFNQEIQNLRTKFLKELETVQAQFTLKHKLDLEEMKSQRHPGLDSLLHRHIGCDGCSTSPIKGVRYKSLSRKNYDLCERCFLLDPYLHEGYIAIRDADPDRANQLAMLARASKNPNGLQQNNDLQPLHNWLDNLLN